MVRTGHTQCSHILLFSNFLFLLFLLQLKYRSNQIVLSTTIIMAANFQLIINSEFSIETVRGSLVAARAFLLSIFPRSFVISACAERKKKKKEKAQENYTTRNRNYNIKEKEHPSTRPV